jgi:hypothetical protein
MQAGSDSISMFEINPTDPTQISQVGEPVNSGGNFPLSIDVSNKTGDGELESYGIENRRDSSYLQFAL